MELRTTSLSIGVLVLCTFVQASEPHSHGTARGAIVVRTDRVGKDMHTVTDGHSGHFRTVLRSSDGTYHVVVRNSIGLKRMEGTYLDSELKVPHGHFVHYHPNGRVESEGEYVHGEKTGTWSRMDAKGEMLAERNYAGMDWETLERNMGLSTMAPTLGASSNTARQARRWSLPMDF